MPQFCHKFCKAESEFEFCDAAGNIHCVENRYGKKCAKECIPKRNKIDGYFACSAQGDKTCPGRFQKLRKKNSVHVNDEGNNKI